MVGTVDGWASLVSLHERYWWTRLSQTLVCNFAGATLVYYMSATFAVIAEGVRFDLRGCCARLCCTFKEFLALKS